MRVLAAVLALALPVAAGAQTPEWQPTWRFVSGVLSLGAGVALLSLSVAYGDRVLSIEERALAASDAAEVATNQAMVLRLRDRIDDLNQRGDHLEGRHLATLASGALLAAAGLALVIWDGVREPTVALQPHPGGLAVRLDW